MAFFYGEVYASPENTGHRGDGLLFILPLHNEEGHNKVIGSEGGLLHEASEALVHSEAAISGMYNHFWYCICKSVAKLIIDFQLRSIAD